MVLKSELNSANKLEAINTSAVPVVTYSFNIINWTLQELAKLDTKTRKFLTTYKIHHPKSDVGRLYLPRTEGGRGLIQLELSYKSTTNGLDKCLQETQDTLLHFVKDHDDRKSLYSISRQSMKFSRETGSACNTTCRECGEHHPCPQNKGQGQTPGSPTAQVQVGIKSAPRQIPTTGETG